MNNYEIINNLFDNSAHAILESKKLTNQISEIVDIIVKAYGDDNKVVIFGNGGSAADSQHFAAELIGRYKLERKSLPAIALTTDSSIITALGNDYGFEYVFSRQCESIVNTNDVVIAISTSGKSQNVINGVITSKKIGATTIGLLGGNGGNLQQLVDIPLTVSSMDTPRIQEVHRIVIHIICDLVERSFKTV
jgi:D-sedoheptulose 7-phosphate isomerase